ncbi:hypothetical protein MPSI1_000115 [Malassezia psittaci]|uniref:Phosphatidic acid phosphatase type 2/haloperoxidase domain-containing protein n=1 Tax=Malassezia psittaci TaxID=1821823 RepID=A0AAF0F853_9BASI|nr:hypothetical protein MPSI1_000115 [Malassezia psittaci]
MSLASLSGFNWERIGSNAYLAKSIIDWASLITLFLITSLVGLGRWGFRQPFRLDDPNIQYPFTEHERVPGLLLFFYSMLVPLTGVILLSLAHTRKLARLNSAALGLLLTLAATGMITNVIKVWVGRPRPDLLARCHPRKLDPITDGLYHSGFVDDSICTTPLNSYLLEDGFRSFPSGHSSSSFAGLVYLALCVRAALSSVVHQISRAYVYSAAPTDLVDEEHNEQDPDFRRPPPNEPLIPVAFSVLLPLVPVMVAAYVAISRVMDHRHHPTDVLAGASLGTVMAFAVYRATHLRD